MCKTIIGKGIDAVAGTNAAHGEAGVAYTDESRKAIGLPEEKWFVSGDTRTFFKDHAASLSKTCVFFYFFVIWDVCVCMSVALGRLRLISKLNGTLWLCLTHRQLSFRISKSKS